MRLKSAFDTVENVNVHMYSKGQGVKWLKMSEVLQM